MTETMPHCQAAQLQDVAADQWWLIDQLWLQEGVGIVGGHPKSCKSWLSLDMAISVASGTPCLNTYAVSKAGGVLCYSPEDGDHVLKARLSSICQVRGLDLKQLPIEVITLASLRLDDVKDQRRLSHTIKDLKPRMLLLDPLVRLHRIDENDAGEVSGVLGYLRTLQREHHVVVVLVHHTKKNGGAIPGQNLRGSSDLHAWGDSNLYLRMQRDDTLLLKAEHRAAAAPPPMTLRLCTGPTPHLVLTGATAALAKATVADGLANRILEVLRGSPTPVSRADLRSQLHVRNETLGEVLTTLTTAGSITRQGDSWALPPSAVPVPTP